MHQDIQIVLVILLQITIDLKLQLWIESITSIATHITTITAIITPYNCGVCAETASVTTLSVAS